MIKGEVKGHKSDERKNKSIKVITFNVGVKKVLKGKKKEFKRDKRKSERE